MSGTERPSEERGADVLHAIVSEVIHFAAEPRNWLILVALLVAGGVKGGIGFGMPLVAVSLLANIIDLRLIAALMLLPVIAGNLWIGFEGGEFWSILTRFWTVVVAMGIGIFTGAQLLVVGAQSAILLILGIVILVFAITEQFKARLGVQIPERMVRPLGVAAGLLGGVSGGVSTVFGPPVIMYLTALHLSKDSFVRANSVISFFASVFMAAAFLSARLVSVRSGLVSGLCVVPVFAGVYVGGKLRLRVSQRVFERVVAVGLLFLGLNLIRRSLLSA